MRLTPEMGVVIKRNIIIVSYCLTPFLETLKTIHPTYERRELNVQRICNIDQQDETDDGAESNENLIPKPKSSWNNALADDDAVMDLDMHTHTRSSWSIIEILIEIVCQLVVLG